MTVVEETSQQLTQSVATKLAGSVVTKLFVEVDKIATTPVTDGWFHSLMDVIEFSKNVETGFGHAKAYTLAVIRQHWAELPVTIRTQYGFSFMNFARLVTGKERSTIDNYVLTAKVWFMDKVRPPGDIKVLKRDVDGLPIQEGGVNTYQYVPFNPYLVDLSKLLIINSRAAKGQMTDKLWEMLADGFYTCEDVRREHSQTPKNGEAPDEVFMALGPGLFYKDGLDVVCIAETLNWDEYEDNLTVKKGIGRLLDVLGIVLDEDFIFEALKKAYVECDPKM